MAVERVCAAVNVNRATYCGRKTPNVTTNWDDVNCVDCQAARRADQAVAS